MSSDSESDGNEVVHNSGGEGESENEVDETVSTVVATTGVEKEVTWVDLVRKLQLPASEPRFSFTQTPSIGIGGAVAGSCARIKMESANENST